MKPNRSMQLTPPLLTLSETFSSLHGMSSRLATSEAPHQLAKQTRDTICSSAATKCVIAILLIEACAGMLAATTAASELMLDWRVSVLFSVRGSYKCMLWPMIAAGLLALLEGSYKRRSLLPSRVSQALPHKALGVHSPHCDRTLCCSTQRHTNEQQSSHWLHALNCFFADHSFSTPSPP